VIADTLTTPAGQDSKLPGWSSCARRENRFAQSNTKQKLLDLFRQNIVAFGEAF